MFYLCVWRWIFDFDRRNDWSIVLFLVEFLFFIFIFNVKVERLFSLMNRVKIDFRVMFGENIFNSFIRIRMDGSNFEDYDFISVIKLWVFSVTRRSY